MNPISRAILKARKFAGLSQIQLAQKLKLSNKTISAYETDRATPPLNVLMSIARITHTPIHDFFDDGLMVANNSKKARVFQNSNQIRKIIRILTTVGNLKLIKRTGWLVKGIRETESIADHNWRMGFVASLFTPKNLDKTKVLEMCIINDLAKVLLGDVRWESGKKLLMPQKIRYSNELHALADIFSDYPEKERYIQLFRELSQQKTPEAKFVRQVNKLEMVLTALEYEQQGHPSELFDEFWKNADKHLKNQLLAPLFLHLKSIRPKTRW